MAKPKNSYTLMVSGFNVYSSGLGVQGCEVEGFKTDGIIRIRFRDRTLGCKGLTVVGFEGSRLA